MQPSSNNCYDTGLREECGVFGIYDLDGADVSPSIYYGLSALQHRGQESCGIAVSDTSGPKGHVKSYKGLGLVNEVFKESKLEELSGNIGIGHVRYSTTGSTTVENAQPLVLNYLKGSLSLSHNGNLVNAMELREQMENTGAIFHTSIDSEIIAYGIARERVHSKTVEEAILRTVKEIRGAYALVIMSPRKLIGVRDPYGLKPLCIGKRDNAWVLASESCALTSIGAEFVRDVAPGEIVTFDKTGNLKSEFMPVDVKKAHCIFEYIYFARTDSIVDGIREFQSGNYEARISGVGSDEFAAIAKAFNGMAQSTEHLVNDVYEVMIQKQDAELQMLQAKINPHFMYNIFSIISQLASAGKDEDIIQIARKTSGFYRRALSRRTDGNTLADEIAILDDYFDIIEIQRPGAVQKRYEIEPGLEACLMPNFILQPIVENAVKHAMVDGKIGITVRACREGADMRITVSDDGIGMTPQQAEEIFRFRPGSGYGLYNISERMRLRYSEARYDITCESRYGQGTDIILVLPLRTQLDEEAEENV